MNTKYLLFVEDRKDQRMLFEDAIADWNTENANIDRRFECQLVADYDSAKLALERGRFDGALVDLRLPSKGQGNIELPLGNKLALQGLHQNGIPVAIISALTADLEPEIANSTTIKIFDKGDDQPYSAPVNWFGQMWLMMEVLAASRATIRKLSADVFVDRLWPRWASYVEAMGHQSAQLTPIVTRQHVWHMGEVLGLDGKDEILWHPFENYICPALQPDRPHTGDIYEFEGSLWIVLTPPCDMANGKISEVLLAACKRDALPDWNAKVVKLKGAANSDQIKSYSEYFRKLVNQNSPGQHFLPPLPGDTQPLMVQFGQITTKSLATLKENLATRRASVTAPFLTNLTQRFGAHISRVGQPNIDTKHFA